MQVTRLDPFDDEEFERYYAILHEAITYQRPEAPMWSKRETAVALRVPDDAIRSIPYAAYRDGTMVGAALMEVPLLDNTNMTWCLVGVAPRDRRQGVGGALVEVLVDETRRLGRDVILAEAGYGVDEQDDHPYRRFAESHGFALASTEVCRRLDLPVPEQTLHGWIDEAAPHHTDYRVETFLDDVPDPLVPSLCHVLNQLALDAPTGDIEFEAERVTPEVWRQREAKRREQGRTSCITVAIDPRGEVVAATSMMVPEDDPTRIYQWATLVLRGHRGHRLGLAIKARNQLEVQKAFPERTHVWTSNQETNAPMVAINERMGFRPVEVSAEFQRKL